MATKRTELGEKRKSVSTGSKVFFIILGIMGLFVGISFIPIITIPVSIIFIIVGFAKTGYIYKAKCPYCDKDIEIFDTEKTHKCKYCKKISTRKENFLETIE